MSKVEGKLPSHSIFANRLKLVYKNGMVVDFTHVTFLRRRDDRLIIYGETEVDKMRKNVQWAVKLERLRLMITEFYTPRT